MPAAVALDGRETPPIHCKGPARGVRKCMRPGPVLSSLQAGKTQGILRETVKNGANPVHSRLKKPLEK